MQLPRSSGVLLHLTSLPGGRLGREAYRFVDWLAAAGQSWWQVLPLVPPDRYHSPYKSRSAFAAWPGFLASPRAAVSRAEMLDFRDRNAYWIEDWAKHAGGGAIADQVRFEREWGALREYAGERGVKLLGDVAIYVAPDSVDHRSHPKLFQDGAVAGAPPDLFTSDGQLWGNPLYDWPAMQREGYHWWVQRIARTLTLFDVARIDHFRGFVAYWAVPADAPTAKAGRWQRGPGRAVFAALERDLGPLPLIAEDLGVITPGVRRLRERLGLPGMVVLQFGFDSHAPKSVHRPRNHTEDRVVYTGTHDHDTARGWYESLDRRRRAIVDAELQQRGIVERESWWALIRLAFSSPARVAVIQAQDVLGLGSEARMNDPGRRSGNWRWQLQPRALKPALARRLREATEEAGRAQPPSR
ncbi:MAG TPA: 4-alpha-glucanotransferase [Solirubrobacteraceae bacterium]|jgi:4-alpha-glucanotransferase